MRRKFNILDFGAIAGKDELQHKHIQAAIDACFLSGGGEVVIPSGRFRMGAVRLRSNVTLHLLSGAVLEGSRDPEDYFIMETDKLEPVPEKIKSHAAVTNGRPEAEIYLYAGRWHNGLIRAYKAENIAVIGEKGSLIDGKNCYDEGGEEHYRGPHGLSFIFCRHIVLRGYTMQNSSNWPESIWHSSDILCENITNLAGHDGVHMTGCDDIIVRRCNFYTGDDCVAGFDNRNVLVEDCVMNTACSAFRFGGTNVLIHRCKIFAPAKYSFRGKLTTEEKKAGIDANDADQSSRRFNMLSLFTYYADFSSKIRFRPGNIVIRDCVVEGADRLICYNYSGNSRWQINRPLGNITLEHITARDLSMPLYLYGDDKLPVSLKLSDVKLSYRADCGDTTFIHAGNFAKIVLDNVTLNNNKSANLINSWDKDAAKKVKANNVKWQGSDSDLIAYPETPFECRPI